MEAGGERQTEAQEARQGPALESDGSGLDETHFSPQDSSALTTRTSQAQRAYAFGVAPRARDLAEFQPDAVSRVAEVGLGSAVGPSLIVMLLPLFFIFHGLGPQGSLIESLVAAFVLAGLVRSAYWAYPLARIWYRQQAERRWDREYQWTRQILLNTGVPLMIVDPDAWEHLLSVTGGTVAGWVSPKKVNTLEEALVFAACHFPALRQMALGAESPDRAAVLEGNARLAIYRAVGGRSDRQSENIELFARLAAICDFFADDFKELEAGFKAPRLRRHRPANAGSLRQS